MATVSRRREKSLGKRRDVRHFWSVGRTELGRVLDKEALEASDGPRGLFRAQIPAAWATSGCEIDLALPSRVECARCSGGGCDRCGRSGALRMPSEPVARSVRLTIPAGSASGVALRLVRPFGDAGAIEQLIIEVRCGEEPSAGVSLIHLRRRRGDRHRADEPRAPARARAGLSRAPAADAPREGDVMNLIAVVAIVAAAVAGFLSSR